MLFNDSGSKISIINKIIVEALKNVINLTVFSRVNTGR